MRTKNMLETLYRTICSNLKLLNRDGFKEPLVVGLVGNNQIIWKSKGLGNQQGRFLSLYNYKYGIPSETTDWELFIEFKV